MNKSQIKQTFIILPGCISPNAQVPMLAVSNSEERKKQTISAIRFYIEHSIIPNIVYCDNSGEEPYEELVNLALRYNKRLEWLYFNGNSNKAIERGKGFGEGEIIDFIRNNSEIWNRCHYFIKINSRVIVKNINMITRGLSYDSPCFFPIYQSEGKPFLTTKLYCMSTKDYVSHFANAYLMVDDTNGFYLENAFAKIVDDESINIDILPYFPRFSGISGTSGLKIDEPFWSIMKHDLSFRLRRLHLLPRGKTNEQ